MSLDANLDALVLRAMLRLSRRREAAEEESIALRAGGTGPAVRASLRRLAVLGLVERRDARAPRLTMQGLAVAVALLPRKAVRQPRTPRRASRAA